jgi:hypothetical protein
VSETDQLKAEISELREAVLNLAATVVMIQHACASIPDPQRIAREPKNANRFLQSMALWLKGAASNTQGIYEQPWAQAIEKRHGQTIEQVRSRFADGESGKSQRFAGGNSKCLS